MDLIRLKILKKKQTQKKQLCNWRQNKNWYTILKCVYARACKFTVWSEIDFIDYLITQYTCIALLQLQSLEVQGSTREQKLDITGIHFEQVLMWKTTAQKLSLTA